MSFTTSTSSSSSSSTNGKSSSSKSEIKAPRRGFKISHQKIVLDIDILGKTLKGYTEITIVPQTRKLHTIKLNARQFSVSKVLVNAREAKFEQSNVLEVVVADESTFDLKSFNICNKAALDRSDDGELQIELPDNTKIEIRQSNDSMFMNESTDSVKSMDEEAKKQYESMTVRVEYELVDPKGGVRFVLPDPVSFPNRAPHMFTDHQPNSARMWFPCVDTFTELCTYEMEYTTLASLVVVSSGELQEQVFNEDQTKKTFYYKLRVPSAPHSIALTVGPFEVLPDPNIPSVTHFCLPGRMTELAHTTSFLVEVFNHYEEFLGVPFPFDSYKQVFVEEAYNNYASFSTCSIFSTHLLYGESIIDQVYKTRRIIAQALAEQYFGNFIGIKSWPDWWLKAGLSGYITNLFYRKMFGNNAFRFRLVKQMDEVMKLDINKPPIHWAQFNQPSDYIYNQLIKKKSPVVMYLCERRIGTDALSKVLMKITSPPNEGGDQQDRLLSTRRFIKLCKKFTAGPDIKTFEKRWISGRGYPSFLSGFSFNKKRQQIEFALKQDFTAGSRVKFTGALTVRVNEVDGTFDHAINFDEDPQTYDFPCNSRMRKNRRKRIKYANGDEVEVDMSKTKNDTPLLCIRPDPDLDWIRNMVFRQPEFMWVHQIETDRDVVAQYEAVKALREFGTSSATNALYNVLGNEKIFYLIRIEAARLIAEMTSKESNWLGLDLLLKFYKATFYGNNHTIIKPNNFSNFILYFIQKNVAGAIGELVFDRRERDTPPEVIDFLLDLLKNNDNSLNEYSDSEYIATLIRALAKTTTIDPHVSEKIQKHALLYLNMEKIVSSYKNAITSACLEVLCDLQMKERMNKSLDVFFQYTKYGYYDDVRITAWKSILRISSLSRHEIIDTMNTFLDFIEKDDEGGKVKAKLIKWLCSEAERRLNRFFETDSPSTALMLRLWKILNTSPTSYDTRLRKYVYDLYKKIWGTEEPRCLPSSAQDKKNLFERLREEAKTGRTENRLRISISRTPDGKVAAKKLKSSSALSESSNSVFQAVASPSGGGKIKIIRKTTDELPTPQSALRSSSSVTIKEEPQSPSVHSLSSSQGLSSSTSSIPTSTPKAIPKIRLKLKLGDE